MIGQMLDQADAQLDLYSRSAAAKRRAVSTAYYAAFHAIMWTCARRVLPSEAVDTDAFERVYRGVDHGSVKGVFQPNGALSKLKIFDEIGTDIVQLQAARIRADYSSPRRNLFQFSEAKEHVARARKIVTRLSNLGDEDRQILAIHLLFPVRKK